MPGTEDAMPGLITTNTLSTLASAADRLANPRLMRGENFGELQSSP